MDQLVEIKKVVIGPKYLQAQVVFSESAPLTTDQDIEATARIYNLMPHITEHVCVGDKGETFKEAMPSTELAHLLEHMTVELMAQTGLAGDISSGRTYYDNDNDRSYFIQLACVDDVLVAGALSSAVWILQWAFTGGEGSVPDIDGIVEGLRTLVSTACSLEEAQESPSVDTPLSEDDDTTQAEKTSDDQVDNATLDTDSSEVQDCHDAESSDPQQERLDLPHFEVLSKPTSSEDEF